MPLHVQGSDKTKLEVHISVRAWLKVKNSYKISFRIVSQCLGGGISSVVMNP